MMEKSGGEEGVVTESGSLESRSAVDVVAATGDDGLGLAITEDHHIPSVLIQINVLHIYPFLHIYHGSLVALLLHRRHRLLYRLVLPAPVLRHHHIRRRRRGPTLQQPPLRRPHPLREPQQPPVDRAVELRQQSQDPRHDGKAVARELRRVLHGGFHVLKDGLGGGGIHLPQGVQAGVLVGDGGAQPRLNVAYLRRRGELSGSGEGRHGVVEAGHGVGQDGSADVDGLLHARVLGGGAELGRVMGEVRELVDSDAEGKLEEELWISGVGVWEGGDA